MSKRLTIFFDMDGVLADFVQGFTWLAKSLFPEVPVTYTKNKHQWDGFPGMTDNQIKHTWDRVHTSFAFWKSLPCLVTAPELERLYVLHDEQDVYFTTNRHGVKPLQQTKQWLEDYGICNPNVILVERKGELARALNADFMIDDKAGNAIYAAYHAPQLRSFILDRPYNQFPSAVVGSKVTRVSTIKEYLDAIWKS